MRHAAIALLFAIGTLCMGQAGTTVNVKDFPGQTVGQKMSAAQAKCGQNGGSPCTLVLDPSLATLPEGTVPPACPNCALQDNRSTSPAGISLIKREEQRLSGPLTAPGLTASVNKVLLVTAPPYNAKCNGTTDDQAAIQAAFTDAKANGYLIQFPAGICRTSTVTWLGQSFFGAGMTQTTIQGQPGQDVFATPDSSTPLTFGTYVHDLTINVDSSIDKSASAAGGDNTFPNRISGTAGGTTPIADTFGGPPVPGGMHFDGALGGNCYGSMTSGSPTFTLPCSYFTNVWSRLIVGQPITLSNAGSNGGPLTTTVSAVVDNTHLTLAANAFATTTTATGNIGRGLTPPWYFGNCGFAFPASSGAAMSGTNGWVFRNIQFQTTSSPGVGGNHTCGVFQQAFSNNITYDNVSAIGFYGGIIEAPPVSNNTAYYAWTPDTNIYSNVNIKWSLLPMVWYNGIHRVVHGLSMYQAHRPFGTGLWQIGTPLGSSATAYPSATITEYYNEGWGLNSGEASRFFTQGGDADKITGTLGTGGTSYVNWLGNGGTVNGSFASNLQIKGNSNKFLNTNLQPGNVIDLGFENSVQTGLSASDAYVVRSWYNDPVPPQEPVGKLDGGFVLSGNTTTPFVSGSDLVTTCRDYRFAIGRNSKAKCTNDPTGPEVSKSYMHSIGPAGFGTGAVAQWSFLMTAGPRIPLTKVFVVTQARCEETQSCSSVFKLFDLTSRGTALASCNVTYGSTWTIQGSPSTNPPCLVDLSTVRYGDVIGWSFNNFTGNPSSVDLAFVAFEPLNLDVLNMAKSLLMLPGKSNTIGGAPLGAGSCASGTAVVTGAAADMVVDATPATDPGDRFLWKAYVSNPGIVTVKVCNSSSNAAAPQPTTYNVRVFQ